MSEVLIVILMVLGAILLFVTIFLSIEHPEFYPAVWRKVTGNWTGRHAYGYTYHEIAGMSERAWKVLRHHNTLPPEHRLNVDILGVLKSYDLKNGGKDKVDGHFNSYSGECYCPQRIHGNKYVRDCAMADYTELYDSITEIKTALVAQQEVLAAAAVEGVTNNMPLLIERAREEAEIIRSTTRELT